MAYLKSVLQRHPASKARVFKNRLLALATTTTNVAARACSNFWLDPRPKANAWKLMVRAVVKDANTEESIRATIREYKPKSTLVVPQHPVPRAKFPVVDIHSHTAPTPTTIDRLIQEMDALNIRVLNNLSGGYGADLKQRVDYIRGTKHANRFTVFANLNFGGFAAGWGAKAAAQLEQDAAAVEGRNADRLRALAATLRGRAARLRGWHLTGVCGPFGAAVAHVLGDRRTGERRVQAGTGPERRRPG